MPPTENMTRIRALLICMGLVYLAVPNLLFLAGWFTPPVAIGAGILLLLCVGGACVQLWRRAVPDSSVKCPGKHALWLALLFLFLLLFFLTGGIVGVFRTHGDYTAFRQALFCNLRDAAWPVILPNGKEMTYYLANMLPPAVMGRLLPGMGGQWGIAVWAVLPVWLAVLMVADILKTARVRYALLMAAVAIFLARDPLYSICHTFIGDRLCQFLLLFHLDFTPILCPHIRMHPALGECLGAYNSVPLGLLAAAIMLGGGRENRSLVPLIYALLLACAPIICIGLLPLACVLYYKAWQGAGLAKVGKGVLLMAPLPAVMLALAFVYFSRAESDVCLAPFYEPWGWQDGLLGVLRITLAWGILIFPLYKAEKKNVAFQVTALFLLLVHFIYLGSMEVKNNELWLKSCPAYLLVVACLWAKNWQSLPRFKWVVLVLCVMGAFHFSYKGSIGAGLSHYGQVADVWNGHLNHDHFFLKQSVPATREPLVPGILLRESGASERQFPGNLLPAAPGCDYTRPALPYDWSGN